MAKPAAQLAKGSPEAPEITSKPQGLPPYRGQALSDYQLGTKKRKAMEVMMKNTKKTMSR
jgi:hypothetical protein